MREWERDSVHGAQCGRMGNGEEETGNPAGREGNRVARDREGKVIGKAGDTERHWGEGGEDYVITMELAGGNIT